MNDYVQLLEAQNEQLLKRCHDLEQDNIKLMKKLKDIEDGRYEVKFDKIVMPKVRKGASKWKIMK